MTSLRIKAMKYQRDRRCYVCICEYPLGSKERRHETQFGIQSENHQTVNVDLGRHWGTCLRVDVALLLLKTLYELHWRKLLCKRIPDFIKTY